MRHYRNDPEKTADAIDPDGWLHTGDIGTIDAEGYVRIVDRRKELIINSAEEHVPVQHRERGHRECPLIGSVVAIGDQRKFVSALIALDAEAAAAFAAANGIENSAPALATDPGLWQVIADAVAAANARLSRVEHIRAGTVLPTFWEPGGDELTPTMKPKRKPIAAKYASEIDAM